ncbi:conserved hypothetical protein [Solidesulfovibrio fructosivorans JJ]]|uniref:Uncharacterized protein n=1 Tax=Solidesulfovibrio fructosivorans JJ] TaxID=596151 RepID=E1JTJ2_SOLFR|nr:tetratricopeptide repeat protein [Solidesulfovibrio fructosivorans]EFL52452.1 conserved hypothetical protein [Solidesulfovibrio fructosivorans JJ]]
MKFRTLVAPVLLGCLAGGLSGCGALKMSSSEPAKDLVASGNAAYDRKDYAAACRDLSQAGATAGAVGLSRAGDACLRDGRRKAVAAYEAAASAAPGDAAALEGLGMAALSDGDIARARDMLKAAAKAGGKDPRAALALGDAELLSGQCEAALAAYREALSREASFAPAKSRLQSVRLVCGARKASAPAAAPAASRSAAPAPSDLSPASGTSAGSAKEPGKAKAAPKVIDLNDI